MEVQKQPGLSGGVLQVQVRRNPASPQSFTVDEASVRGGSPCRRAESREHALYTGSTGRQPPPSYQNHLSVNARHECNTHTGTHTQSQADTLTDGMKQRQRCERTASIKQTGAKRRAGRVKKHPETNKQLFMLLTQTYSEANNTGEHRGEGEGRRGRDSCVRTPEQGFQRAPWISSQADRYDANKIKGKGERGAADEGAKATRRGCEDVPVAPQKNGHHPYSLHFFLMLSIQVSPPRQ